VTLLATSSPTADINALRKQAEAGDAKGNEGRHDVPDGR